MRILVTGSSGHLGEALIRELGKGPHNICGVDIKPSKYTTNTGSVSDRKFIRECMRNIDAVIHTATLHKPHIGTHNYQEFIDTNITGTLVLLQEAAARGVKSFIFTSTTSTFGDTLTPGRNKPAIWVTEETPSIPKNIYGVTKSSAEDLCQLFYRNHNLPCIILKTSRFFPEEDDNKKIREQYEDLNIKANEYLYRRVDIEDVVNAHICSLEKVQEIGFGKYIISSTTPFTQDDLTDLNTDAPSVVERLYPGYKKLYKNWEMFPRIDRVYVNRKARIELDWKPKYDFSYVLECLKQGKDFRSPLSTEIGIKRYHSGTFEEGPYPVS